MVRRGISVMVESRRAAHLELRIEGANTAIHTNKQQQPKSVHICCESCDVSSSPSFILRLYRSRFEQRLSLVLPAWFLKSCFNLYFEQTKAAVGVGSCWCPPRVINSSSPRPPPRLFPPPADGENKRQMVARVEKEEEEKKEEKSRK